MIFCGSSPEGTGFSQFGQFLLQAIIRVVWAGSNAENLKNLPKEVVKLANRFAAVSSDRTKGELPGPSFINFRRYDRHGDSDQVLWPPPRRHPRLGADLYNSLCGTGGPRRPCGRFLK
jgi:hypothetical protein